MTARNKNLLRLTISVVVCLSAGFFGSFFTSMSVDTWYADLIKPSFTPPSWMFAPVWTVLYIMMGVSAYLIWKEGLKTKNVKVALFIFAIQLMLNFVWSVIFFGLRLPQAALIEISLLFISITICVFLFWKINRFAAVLLMPYLIWVGFASVLNFCFVKLN